MAQIHHMIRVQREKSRFNSGRRSQFPPLGLSREVPDLRKADGVQELLSQPIKVWARPLAAVKREPLVCGNFVSIRGAQ